MSEAAETKRTQCNAFLGRRAMQNAMAPNDIAKNAFAPSFGVKVLRSAADHNRFWWLVRGTDGGIIDSSPRTYSSEAEARGAADAAIRPLLERRAS